MWIVKVALDRPYTFIVLAVLIVLLGVFTILRTAVDIFPNIPIPIVATAWNFTGLQPEEMANRIVMNGERVAQTTVNDVEHTESQSLGGIGIVKFFFQPNVNEDMAVAQIVGISQTQLRFSPAGTQPPIVLAYNASTVPVIQLALTSQQLSETQIADAGNVTIRTALSSVTGAAIPAAYGGKIRQVQVDLDPAALRAYGITAQDVSAAVGAQNLIVPAGTEKIGNIEYIVKLNASPTQIEELNDAPVGVRDGRIVHIRDVAHVRDGAAPQSNIVRVDGNRAVLMTVLKSGAASTLSIIDGIKSKLPAIRATLPDSLSINAIGDQSLFVEAAITGVAHEAIIATLLTGVMILFFLGSYHSTLIIVISIPLSILTSIICLSAIGQTMNIMTLGGLALSIGILVDGATVTVENITYHLERGKGVEAAILDGADQISVPALVSTLAICIVFVPMFLLTGIAKYLFVPMAEAVIFAMLASYLLSRTLVPTLAKYWLKPLAHGEHGDLPDNALMRFQKKFEYRFEELRRQYYALLESAQAAGPRFVVVFFTCMVGTAILAFPIGPLPGLGQDFFPSVDGGQIKLHIRAPTGTRIEETAALCDHIEATIRQVIPPTEIANIVDNLGLPFSSISSSYINSGTIGPQDGDIYISLTESHGPTAEYVTKLRERLNAEFPSVTFAFLAADITSQILNFGLPAPIDVQVSGFNFDADRKLANYLLEQLRRVPGTVDTRIQQAFDYPQLEVNVNRVNAMGLGLTQQSIASNLLISLSGSFQAAPTFWVDNHSGVQYNISTQVPQHRLSSINDLATTPLSNTSVTGGVASQVLANVAAFKRSVSPAVVSHYNAVPTIDIYSGVEGIDLGYVTARVHKVVDGLKNVPKGTQIAIRGQAETMTSSFSGLLIGLAGAVILVYLLIVVNFQSWVDPFIIITALPAALAGIVWMLFLSFTTVSVPVLTGAIMCMGVATANSILVVSFARERMDEGLSPRDAALEAGFTRFRPVIMTALAMIIGMIPMALGLGKGGEQNAPLGRAVIGGLMFATVATLIFVPVIFTLIHDRLAARAGRKSSGDDNASA